MKTLRKLLLALAAVIFVCANAHATMFWARPYDPNLQRWLTRDRIGELGVINLYQFVGNNPINRIDPWGLAWYDWLNPVSYSSGYAGVAGDQALYAQARAHGYSSYSDALDQLNERLNESRKTTVIDDPYLDQRLANQSLQTIGDVAGEAASAYLTAATAVTPTAAGTRCALWTATRSRTTAENAFRHFADHGAEFGAKNAVDYVRQAQDFLHNPPPGTLTTVRANGDIVRFDPASNTFGVMDASGAPRTMFKPDPAVHGYPSNLDYFNAQ